MQCVCGTIQLTWLSPLRELTNPRTGLPPVNLYGYKNMWAILIHCTFTHVYILHIHTYIHTYIHTCIDTYIHTCIPPTFLCEYYQISAALKEVILHRGVRQEYRAHCTAYDTHYAPVCNTQWDISNTQDIERNRERPNSVQREKLLVTGKFPLSHSQNLSNYLTGKLKCPLG